MKTFKILSFIFILATLSSNLSAQLWIKGDFRTRAEIRNGYMEPATENNDPATFISQRSRLLFGYDSDKYKILFSLQDVRVWGQSDIYTGSGVWGDSKSIVASEAWLEYYLSKSISLKLGRQFLAYDDQRLIATRDWNQNGMSYDALLLKYKKKDWQFDLGASFNNNDQNLFNHDYNLN